MRFDEIDDDDGFTDFFNRMMRDMTSAMRDRGVRYDPSVHGVLPIGEHHHGDKWESYENDDVIAITMDLHDIVRSVDDIDIQVFDDRIEVHLVGMEGNTGNPVINFEDIFGDNIHVDKNETKSTFKNGILDIVIKKTQRKPNKGKRVKPKG